MEPNSHTELYGEDKLKREMGGFIMNDSGGTAAIEGQRRLEQQGSKAIKRVNDGDELGQDQDLRSDLMATSDE